MEVEFFGLSMSLTWFLVLAAVLLFVLHDSWSHTYWWRKGVIYEPALPILGNTVLFMGLRKTLDILRAKHGRVYGIFSFTIPMLVVGELDLLRHILVKNFDNFHNRPMLTRNNEELKHGIAALRDERWREVRNVLTPTFSASKMKLMSSLVNETADKMVLNIGNKQKKNGFIECQDIFGAFVMDTIGSCAFGLNIDSQANPDDPFVAHAKRAFKLDFQTFLSRIQGLFPNLGKLLNYFGIGLLIPDDVVKFFREVTVKTVALRQSSAYRDKVKRVDFLQLIVDATNQTTSEPPVGGENDDEEDLHTDHERKNDVGYHSKKLTKNVELTEMELIGQAITFFTAGHETTNTTLGFVFYFLAMYPEIQEKLIREIDEMTPSRDSVGYTSVSTMPYLDQVVCETMRFYPPSVVITRACTETFTHDGLTVEKDIPILIPIYAIHHDEEYWPDPEKFDPSRFSKENKERHHPLAWLPFGAGPHNCIGLRFALMETKMAVVRVLQKYRFETCPQTEIPPKLGANVFLSPPNGVTLKAVARKDVSA
ncbi:cytochrome P450 3A14-like [Diadema setosum]|uniref:cytochrome P450 3A14-like n=1 Tax=Diadema setosum TaxID=31175 RepID=UPI003B3A4F6B